MNVGVFFFFAMTSNGLIIEDIKKNVLINICSDYFWIFPEKPEVIVATQNF